MCLRNSDKGQGLYARCIIQEGHEACSEGREAVLKKLSTALFETETQSVSKNALTLGTARAEGNSQYNRCFHPPEVGMS